MSNDELMPEHPAITALRATDTSQVSPRPWDGVYNVYDEQQHLVARLAARVAYIVAAVNAAPVLIAEVERLQAVVEAARVAVEAIKPHHSPCNMGCNCDHCKSDFALFIARRALGLEV